MMSKVVFMGIILFQHGIGPAKEKVRSMYVCTLEVSRSTSPSEVRSFLGLVERKV